MASTTCGYSTKTTCASWTSSDITVLHNWLREFVPFDLSAHETAALLNRLGFEIASVQEFGGKLQGVVTAAVQDVQKHPNADRLSLCKVFDGQSAYSVVCGAPNVRAGLC